MEALARGALRFSRRYTVKELCARWRALLYDPVIAPQAAAQMAALDASMAANPTPPVRQDELGKRKRPRAVYKVRSVYYARKRQVAREGNLNAWGLPGLESQGMAAGTGAAGGQPGGESGGAEACGPQAGAAAGWGMLDLESEDPDFSKMVELLAAGGVGALVGSGFATSLPLSQEPLQQQQHQPDTPAAFWEGGQQQQQGSGAQSERGVPLFAVPRDASPGGVARGPGGGLGTGDFHAGGESTADGSGQEGREGTEAGSLFWGEGAFSGGQGPLSSAADALPADGGTRAEPGMLAKSDGIAEPLTPSAPLAFRVPADQESLGEDAGAAHFRAGGSSLSEGGQANDLAADEKVPGAGTEKAESVPAPLGVRAVGLGEGCSEEGINDSRAAQPLGPGPLEQPASMPGSTGVETGQERGAGGEARAGSKAIVHSGSGNQLASQEHRLPLLPPAPHLPSSTISLAPLPVSSLERAMAPPLAFKSSLAFPSPPPSSPSQQRPTAAADGLAPAERTAQAAPLYPSSPRPGISQPRECFPESASGGGLLGIPVDSREVASSGAGLGPGTTRAKETEAGGEAAAEAETDEELPSFSEAEGLVLDMDLSSGEEETISAQKAAVLLYRQQRRAALRLEQCSAAAMQRQLARKGALAMLYGRHLRFLMTKTEVSMGRRTVDNFVDLDVGKEGRANKVSRQQAQIKLKEDGVFYLRNVGRRTLMVNKAVVETGQRAILGNCCLLEVGGMRLIFAINYPLVQQTVAQIRAMLFGGGGAGQPMQADNA
eukprot:TRINITY_DN12770_c0_g1_i1.p1 TRINITY_DN12770_c0_g1~~TRINITY_DN12770_c0_g1_i1.p1  ORF type:complete len:792 (+),score=217.62 TRINITY_DN12770_c0_g1_i1:53-2377(+)